MCDHCPLELNDDDYQRVCKIQKRGILPRFGMVSKQIICWYIVIKQGANFRDLLGVRVRPDIKVEWDPEVPRQYLSSGKALVFSLLSKFLFI